MGDRKKATHHAYYSFSGARRHSNCMLPPCMAMQCTRPRHMYSIYYSIYSARCPVVAVTVERHSMSCVVLYALCERVKAQQRKPATRQQHARSTMSILNYSRCPTCCTHARLRLSRPANRPPTNTAWPDEVTIWKTVEMRPTPPTIRTRHVRPILSEYTCALHCM